MKSVLFIHLTLFAFIFIGCASTGDIKYLNNDKLSFSESELSKSIPIDQAESRELFLNLAKQDQCFRISMISFIPKESIAGGESPSPVFWILERKFNQSGKITYTEIARNFDADWKSNSFSTICSREDLPIERLAPGLYRLRFSVFRNTPFRVEIEISSNNKISVSRSAEGY